MIGKLNPVLRGWAAYHRTAVSKQTFASIDHTLWWMLTRWAKHRHKNKSPAWITERYLGKFHPARNDRWVFGDRETGAYMTKLAWTPIKRHQMVDGAASPDDPDLTTYWALRRHRHLPPNTADPAPTLRTQGKRSTRPSGLA